MLCTLDFLTCGGQFDGRAPVISGVQWVLTELEGWWGSAAAPLVKHTKRPTGHGSHRSAAYLGDRSYELTVTATSLALDAALMRRTERRMSSLIREPGKLYRLTVEDQAGALCAYVERDGEILGKFRDRLDYSTVWSIPVIAADPFRYSPAWTTVGPSTPGGAGSGGIVTASGSGIGTASPGIATGVAPALATATVVGIGEEDSQVVYQVTGATSGVLVSDTGSDSVVGIRGEIPEGESVFVNCTARPAYDVPGCALPIPAYGAVLGTSNARGAVYVTGGWPRLPPGRTTTFLLTGATGTGAALTVHTRGAWQ